MTVALVAIAGAVHVLEPFLKLATGADAFRRKLRAHVYDIGAERVIDPKNLACLDNVIEQVADEFVVHGWPGNVRTPIRLVMLRRIGWTGYPPVRSGITRV